MCIVVLLRTFPCKNGKDWKRHTTNTKTLAKVWVLVSICHVTRAKHSEMVHHHTKDGFILALKRFANRRSNHLRYQMPLMSSNRSLDCLPCQTYGNIHKIKSPKKTKLGISSISLLFMIHVALLRNFWPKVNPFFNGLSVTEMRRMSA